VAAGLGWTSAHTWLKLPVIDDMDAVIAATTLPVLLLGGEVSDDQDRQFAAWQKALANPQVRGMVVGRSMLYPPDGDVAGAVDAVVGMM
jgi:DhnA family fructose-bisphosphate aldolase class Ia